MRDATADMRIVLTNDDGFDAPGLAALWDAVRRLGDVSMTVIAPRRPHSGRGHVFTERIRVTKIDVPPMGSVYVVDGTPVDCVCAAVHHPDLSRPDWVIAGINRGANLGVDIYTSGTVAAARQAAIFGIPAVAVSQLVWADRPDDWPRSTREAAAVLAALLRPADTPPPDVEADLYHAAVRGLEVNPPGPGDEAPCWNVNLPRLPDGRPTRQVRLVPLSRDPVHLDYTRVHLPDGGEELRYTGRYEARLASRGTDVEAVFGGAVAISRVPV